MLEIPDGYTISVAAVIRNDAGDALLIRRRDNRAWEPPGGALEAGETLEEGASREVYEETGFHVELGPLTGVYLNTARKVAAHVWRATQTDGILVLNDEVSEFRWAHAQEIPKLVAEVYAVRYLDAFQYDGSPKVRWHDGVQLTPVVHPM